MADKVNVEIKIAELRKDTLYLKEKINEGFKRADKGFSDIAKAIDRINASMDTMRSDVNNANSLAVTAKASAAQNKRTVDDHEERITGLENIEQNRAAVWGFSKGLVTFFGLGTFSGIISAVVIIIEIVRRTI